VTSVDDFAWLPAALAESGRAAAPPLEVHRDAVTTSEGGTLSALRWGDGQPELVFLHGGGQNAHTWDLVIALLGRPALAIDLPGHGHSSWRDDRDYSPAANAKAVAEVVSGVTSTPPVVIGMSLGGLTTIALAHDHAALVAGAIIVDITPRADQAGDRVPLEKQGQVALLRGPREFDSLDEMVDAVVVTSPHRDRDVLRRGVVHNSLELPNGRRRWRYDDLAAARSAPGASGAGWNDLGSLRIPLMLVTGGDSAFVSADDLAEFRRRAPDARVESVAHSGHAVQSDQPLALAELIEGFLAS
jgi:pimeloyl-ACP methyl ester carboxylesterase